MPQFALSASRLSVLASSLLTRMVVVRECGCGIGHRRDDQGNSHCQLLQRITARPNGRSRVSLDRLPEATRDATRTGRIDDLTIE